jgi:hypothetical protein
LARDPHRLAPRLDAYCKLFIVEHELMRAGLDWNDLKQALGKLTHLHVEHTEAVVGAIIAGDASALSAEDRHSYDEALASTGLGKDAELERLRFAVRLQALDTKYHELGGLYDRLHAAGRIDLVVLTDADIERAMREPPAGGRAALRGRWIHDRTADGAWSADWQFLWHPPTATCVDLRDPFSNELKVRQLVVPEEVNPINADVLDLLYELTA